MSDVVLRVDVGDPQDETRLAAAIDAFAKWLGESEESDPDHDAPDIMLKTEWQGDQVQKMLIFQDRKWAAVFLQFWRTEQRKH